jgi:protein-S-isoprenylcysteine O-methyltransferase Ste14
MAYLGATLVFVLGAWVVVRWAQSDYGNDAALSWRSTVATWLLYVLHADTVATAALSGVLIVPVPRTPAIVLGATLAAVGIGIFVAAAARLVRDGDLAGVETRRVVTGGVYRISRHPQNVGWGLMLLGASVAGRSVLAVALVALFAVFVDRYADVEERHLLRRFGDAYAGYRDRTAKLIGRPAPET